MGFTIKQLLADPELFLTSLDTCTETVLDNEFAARFDEWKARGEGKGHLVRSSSLGTCIRQAYYSYLSDVERTPVTDPMARRRMFLGFVNENTMGRILSELPGKIHGLESIEQNQDPIHLEMDVEKKIGFAATTDYVMEYTSGDKKYLIPLELKSTGIYKWKDFTYWKYHLKQLLLWVYIAKELGYNVPYAVLLYTRTSTMEMKTCTIAVDTKYSKMGRVIESWEHWRPYIHDLVQTLRESARSNRLPEKPSDVPQYICNSCPHFAMCMRDENIGK